MFGIRVGIFFKLISGGGDDCSVLESNDESIHCFEESAEPLPHLPAGKGTILVRMQEQSVVQGSDWEQCVLVNNAFQQYKT